MKGLEPEVSTSHLPSPSGRRGESIWLMPNPVGPVRAGCAAQATQAHTTMAETEDAMPGSPDRSAEDDADTACPLRVAAPAARAPRGETTGAPRWHIDAAALAVLENVFSMDHFPNVETRKKLGDDLNVSARQIQVWFQNRRQRERKRKEKHGSGTVHKDAGLLSTSGMTTPAASSEDVGAALMAADDADCDDADDQSPAKRSKSNLPLAPMPMIDQTDESLQGVSAPLSPSARNYSSMTLSSS